MQCPPRSAVANYCFLSACLFVLVWATGGSENHWFHFVEVANFAIPLVIYLFALPLKQPARYRHKDNGLSYSMVHLTNSRVFWLHAVSYKYCQNSWTYTLRGGADKSLARPGRKQATATKLGIYSTHSPRSSIHFLARCSKFCKPLKKESEGCPSNQVSAAAMTSASDEKWRPFNCFFSVQWTGGSPTGQDPEKWVGDQDNGSPGRPVSSGLQVSGEPGHFSARTRHPWWPSRGIFPSKCPSIAPADMSNTQRW